MLQFVHGVKTFTIRHQDGLAVAALITLTLLLMNHAHVSSFNQFFLNTSDIGSYPKAAIVLGGGIKDGKPKPILKGRLDMAASLYESGRISEILVSGDNRSAEYSEPEVMKKYLLDEKDISEDAITQDFAGRSTYETCERAKKVFGLSKVLLVSETTHLPRAIYLCRAFGLEAYGAPSEAEAARGLRASQRWREFLASQKAFINVHIKGEDTVLDNEGAL